MLFAKNSNENKANVFSTFILVFLVITATAWSQEFYDVNTVQTIEIYFEQDNWDYLLDNLYAEGEEERLIGTVYVNGVQFDSAGIRYKGNSSYSPNRTKNPLNIKLDHIIDDQEYQGYGTVKLANMFKDPSCVREVLSYEIARNYLPSSQANYANVYINDELMGLYTSVQSVDKFFLDTHFGDDDNPFFKGEIAAQGGPPMATTVWGYHGPDSTEYFGLYELRSDEGWTELINFLDVFNYNPAQTEDVLNIDAHLWMLAFDILMVNLDAPVNFGHNFYLYEDDANRFNPVVWDLNENFGVFRSILSGGGPPQPPLSLIQMQNLDPYFNSDSPDHPIVGNVLNESEYQKIYIAHMKTIIEECFTNGLYEERAFEIQEIIEDDIIADQNSLYTYNDFLENVNNTVGWGMNEIVGITELMEDRIDYLLTHQDFIPDGPGITLVSGPNEPVPANTNVTVTAEVSDAEAVYLVTRNRGELIFNRQLMYDDGDHDDGMAGDQVYGAELVIGYSDIQYYIFAENTDAVSFYPPRAEYEFLTAEVEENSDLVINEFLASNDSAIPDQDGEYDDWIELYNNSDDIISLSGFALSDNPGNLQKWFFPDTTITPHGYLIIWADEDGGQEGLHASFRLSANGETIHLVDGNQQVIDEVSFGAQETDISTGRFPNGTGDFIQMSPTFAAENVEGMVSTDEPEAMIPNDYQLYQNYPNPFNPSTIIPVAIPETGYVRISVFDVLGREVARLHNDVIEAGHHQFTWTGIDQFGSPVASGVYFIQMKSGDFTATSKALLMK